MPLWYLGASPAEDTSVATIDYVNSLALQNLSDAEVKQKIKDYFSLVTYATNSWADSVINSATTGQAFARQTDLTSGVANKIPILGNDAVTGDPILSRSNGPVALTFGKVNASLINRASAQTLPVLSWSPSSYPVKTNVYTETTICTVAVNPTLSSYKVFVSGTINALVTADGQYPQINVRVGGTTGAIVATGYGVGETYPGGDLAWFYDAGPYTYSIPAWANKIDVVVLGAGGGGFNVGGGGGGAGAWATRTITRGTDIPYNLTALTGTVGQGAPPKFAVLPIAFGGATTCEISGLGTLTGVGGQSGLNNFHPLGQTGSGPGDLVYGRINYPGGDNQTVQAAAGNPPGGGGAGGGLGEAGAGANGAAYFYAYVTDDYNYGQAAVVPAPLNSQPVLTGSTTLYVTVSRGSFTGSQTAYVNTSSLNPQISVMVVPA